MVVRAAVVAAGLAAATTAAVTCLPVSVPVSLVGAFVGGHAMDVRSGRDQADHPGCCMNETERFTLLPKRECVTALYEAARGMCA
jgi:hypothetical protein